MMDLVSLFPQPILPAHPDWVELYWKAWQLAVQNIDHGTPQNGFAEAYVGDAFSKNIFQWDTCFIVQYARYGGHCLPVLPSLDNFYHKQEPDGYI
ncbi:MAG: glycoside hydrolase, partial [Anaerolineae bacterium]|nr:glycoside hydrolase [Anaerolineae bacterium]